MAPGGARGIAPALEVGETPLAGRGLDRAQIVAGIVERAGGGLVRKLLLRHEIALDHVEMIEPELDRDALHEPFEREIELRPAEAADQARRHLVGEHDAVDHVDIGDVVGAGHRAVHAVERSGHGRTQERAVVLELIEAQGENAAVLRDGGFDLGDAVRTGAGGEEMLEPVLDPFHRPAGDAGGDRRQHDVGKDRELDAEAAAASRAECAGAASGRGRATRFAITGWVLNGPWKFASTS